MTESNVIQIVLLRLLLIIRQIAYRCKKQILSEEESTKSCIWILMGPHLIKQDFSNGKWLGLTSWGWAVPSSTQLKQATHWLGFSFLIVEDAYSTQPVMNRAGSLAELQLRIYWDGGGVDEDVNKALLSQLPISWELATNQFGLLNQPALAGSGSLDELELKIYFHNWGDGVDELGNKP